MYIPIILGTARVNRQSKKVADFVLSQFRQRNIQSEIVDVRDYQLTATDGNGKSKLAKKFASKIVPSSAVVIVTPEYNHGYPGELKLLLDLLYEEYFGKPVAFCGVSSGPVGGARAVEQLRLVTIELHMIPIRDAIYFPNIKDLFDPDHRIKDSSFFKKIDFLIRQIEKAVNHL